MLATAVGVRKERVGGQQRYKEERGAEWPGAQAAPSRASRALTRY